MEWNGIKVIWWKFLINEIYYKAKKYKFGLKMVYVGDTHIPEIQINAPSANSVQTQSHTMSFSQINLYRPTASPLSNPAINLLLLLVLIIELYHVYLRAIVPEVRLF